MRHFALFLLAALFTSPLHAGEVAPLEPGKPIDYTALAMQPKSWKSRGVSLDLIPWTGKHVVFLTTSAEFDHALMGMWVSRLDAGWEVYTDLTGRPPKLFRQIEGKATIAAVPAHDLTCGAGCGYVGATGIELAMFYDHNYPALKARPKAMPHYVFYEMGRNFYTFGNRHSCFITGFAVFMRYVCMDALKFEDGGNERTIIEGVEPRFSKSGLSFLELFTNVTTGEKAGRIKDANGRIINPSDQPVCYASAMLRLRRENGRDAWVKRFYQHLATCPESDPATEAGALQQGSNWMICASLAAQRDLSHVFADEWHFPLSASQRAVMAKTNWKQADLTVASVSDALAHAK